MRKTILPALVLSLAAAALAATGTRITKYDLTGWRTLEMRPDRITASGGAPVITSGDGKLRLSADKIILSVGGERGRKTILTAEAVGRVRFLARRTANESIVAASDKGVITPARSHATFTGNVKIISRDPSGTSELATDTVELDMKTGRVVATSAPSKSRLSSTQKPGE